MLRPELGNSHFGGGGGELRLCDKKRGSLKKPVSNNDKKSNDGYI